MTFTTKSSVSALRRQAQHLDDLMSEPADFQQRSDTTDAIRELRGVIHMKLREVEVTRVDLKDSIRMAEDGHVTVLLQPEDVPVLKKELSQWDNVHAELIEILANHL